MVLIAARLRVVCDVGAVRHMAELEPAAVFRRDMGYGMLLDGVKATRVVLLL